MRLCLSLWQQQYSNSIHKSSVWNTIGPDCSIVFYASRNVSFTPERERGRERGRKRERGRERERGERERERGREGDRVREGERESEREGGRPMTALNRTIHKDRITRSRRQAEQKKQTNKNTRKKGTPKTHKRLKERFFTWTKQDKTCNFSRKSSFSSYVQHKAEKQTINSTYRLWRMNDHVLMFSETVFTKKKKKKKPKINK